MSFKITKTLQDQGSDIRYDVETIARLELSDIDYLISFIQNENCESRMKRIHYETVVLKLSTVYQLAMDAYKYLGLSIKNDLNPRFGDGTFPDLIRSYRNKFLHHGIHFLEKTTIYPFGKIDGRGFKGIHIKKGATFEIKNVWKFSSDTKDFALTSEGVFEIENPETKNESWTMLNDFPTIIATDFESIKSVITGSITELKLLWKEISEKIKYGDGTHAYSFLNENGKWDLIEKNNGSFKTYSAEKSPLVIKGNLTITPPSNIKLKNGNLEFE
jgi:hypothetical protein